MNRIDDLQAMWRTFLRRWLGRRGYPLPPYRLVTLHKATVRQLRTRT